MAVVSAEPSTQFYSDRCTSYNTLGTIIDRFVQQFEEIIQSYVRFHLAAWTILGLELLAIILFSTFLLHSAWLAGTVALFFLTLFSYFMLRVYFQAQKPEQFLELREEYLAECKKNLRFQEGIAEHHTALASACGKLASALQGKEATYYKPPALFRFMNRWIEKFSAWWHWHDFHKLKELLLMASVEEHIKLVRCSPTSLELHAALANAYVMLSALYLSAAKLESENRPYTPSSGFIELMRNRFRKAAERAIEEFKILNEYAPQDPWVHSQLAYSYRDLQMPQEEIKEYETIMQLRPEDKDTFYKLGVLYFEQGLNAKGLAVYEGLKKAHYQKADQLIHYYGAYKELDS